MTYIAVIDVFCDRCPNHEQLVVCPVEDGEIQENYVEVARKKGWLVTVHEDGQFVDLCPRCKEEE